MIDHALGLLRTRLTDKGIDPTDLETVVKIKPQSPWILIDFLATLDKAHEFAIWKSTGVIFTCIDGEVQEPPIYVPPEFSEEEQQGWSEAS